MYTLTIIEKYTDGTQSQYTYKFRFKWVRNLVRWWYKQSEDNEFGESPVTTNIEIL